MSGAGFEVIEIDRWRAFVDLVTGPRYRGWAFRGQAKGTWKLWCSLSRYLWDYGVHQDHWQIQEERILRIFKRKAHLFLTHNPSSDNDFQWLAMMQHHGAPTRLLDFTWSPYVAAFFALERSMGDAAIWGINPRSIRYVDAPIPLHDGHQIDPKQIDPRDDGNLQKHFLEARLPFAWLGEPQVMNHRLISQSGTFLLPGILEDPVETILERYPDPADTIVKFHLDGEALRVEGMEELYHMNVTNATLFPDLDGLARSLGYELEFHWAQDVRKPL